MNKLFYIIASFLLIASASRGQDHQITFKIAKATFSNLRMKEWQQTIRRTAIVDAKITDAFPAYINYEFQFEKRLNKQFSVGILAGYCSTGGRIYYEDYSGFMRYDQLMDNTFAGVVASYNLIKDSPILQAFMNVNYGFSGLLLDYELSVDGFSERTRYNLKSRGFSFEPGLQVSIPIYKFELGVYASGLLNVSDAFRFQSDKDLILLNRNDQVNPNWTGIRYGIVSSFNF